MYHQPIFGTTNFIGKYFILKFDYFYVIFITYRVLMDCIYTGFFNTNHYKKRKLAGSEKERSLDAMLNRHIAPSVYRRNEANRLMIDGK